MSQDAATDSPAAAATVPMSEAAIARLMSRLLGQEARIGGLAKLTGGASQESWAFRAGAGGRERAYVLRRAPPLERRADYTLSLEEQAAVITAAASAGVPVPDVVGVLEPADALGSGFVMTAVEGETIARRILRDARFDAVRPRLAGQCGGILARIHSVDARRLPPLPVSDARAQLRDLARRYDQAGSVRPVFDLALRWLERRLPAPAPARLVHGDFRNGNLIIGEDGVRAVLDWELTHLGDPAEDLGWLCVRSWRFGKMDAPAGGFGGYADLVDGYQAVAGERIDLDRIRFWEVLGTLKWGLMCLEMFAASSETGQLSVERAMIGRRASETELDLLILIEEAS